MGGRLGVTSRAGAGSTFCVSRRLPLAESGSATPPPPWDLAGVRVLIVDDNPVNRRVLHEQVVRWGLRDDSTGISMLIYQASSRTPARCLGKHMASLPWGSNQLRSYSPILGLFSDFAASPRRTGTVLVSSRGFNGPTTDNAAGYCVMM
jgi:hypothetical protein